MSRFALTGACIYSPFQKYENGVVLVRDSKIEAVGPASLVKIPADYRRLPLDGLIIAPGFIDLSFFSDGNASVTDANAASFAELAQFQATHGVTAFVAATGEANLYNLFQIAESYAEFCRLDHKGAQCLGLRLEGPFLVSNNPENDLNTIDMLPTFENIFELHRMSEKGIKILGIAPEMEGVMNLADGLRTEGIVLTISHSKADYETVIQANQAGFSGVSDCFRAGNALWPKEPGLIGAALTLTELMVEVISDRNYLHPAILNLLWETRGAEGLILVSNFSGCEEFKGLARPDLNGLAAEITTIDKALHDFLTVSNCNISEGLRLATYNPAKLLGINKRKGSLYPGKDADIVVLTPELDVVMTMVEGEIISGLISL